MNGALDALLSGHKGDSRPAYAVAGTTWVDDAAGTTWVLYVFDGTDDIEIGRFDTTTNKFSASTGSVALSALADMDQALMLGRPLGAGSGAPQYLTPEQIRALAAAAPQPINAAGIGQMVPVTAAVGAGYTLPSGGTWFHVLFRFNTVSSGSFTSWAVGYSAGGTSVGSGAADNRWFGLAWRIS